VSLTSQRSLLILLFVLAFGFAGFWFLWQRDSDRVPMTALVPATRIGSGESVAVSMPPLATSLVDAVVRKEVLVQRVPAAHDVPASTGIELRLVGADAEALAGVTVGISAPATPDSPACVSMATTNQAGLAHFEVPAGRGRSVSAWCALGAEVRTTLNEEPLARIELRIVPRALVDGLVVDASGQGIADAEIVVVPWQDRGGPDQPNTWRVGRSGADGRFRVGLTQATRIAALHHDFSPSATTFVPAEPDRSKPPSTPHVYLQLMTLQARATGIVVDAAGTPVDRAMLEFRPRATRTGEDLKAPPQRATTGPDGRFEVHHLLPGDTVWAVRAAGLGTTLGTLTTGAGETADLRITLDAGAVVHGNVVDENGEAVPGVRVFTGRRNTFESEATSSAADGSFELSGLGAGPTDLTAIEVRPPGESSRTATVHLELAGGEIAHWQAVLGAAAKASPMLRGIVVDPEGKPLAQWRVTAIQGSRPQSQCRTGPEGQFALGVSGGESVQVLVHAPDQAAMSFPAASLPATDPHAPPLRIVVDPRARFATVRGTVQSSRGEAIPATVSLWHHEMRQFARVEADRNGMFRIERVPAGSVDFYADHPGFAGYAQQSLPIPPGADIDLGIITLGAAAAIHGTITGPDGLPPEQLEIYILTADKRLTADYTAGTYRISSVPSGKQVLQIQGTGVAPVQVVLEVQADTEIVQDIQLQSGVGRHVVVHAPKDAGGFLSLAVHVPGEAHQWLSSQARRGDATAEFLAYMMPGTYELVAWGAEGWISRTNVTFRAEDDSAIEMQLQRQ
jgi:hypothetical protein